MKRSDLKKYALLAIVSGLSLQASTSYAAANDSASQQPQQQQQQPQQQQPQQMTPGAKNLFADASCSGKASCQAQTSPSGESQDDSMKQNTKNQSMSQKRAQLLSNLA